MTTATIGRDPFMPRAPKGRGPALALALLAHALLIGAIAYGVNWRRSETATVAAELWSAVPQAAAPRAVEPPTTPPPTPKPQPAPAPAPPPAPKVEAPSPPDPQIAIEKAKREEAKRAKAEQEEEEREKQRVAQAQKNAEKLKAEKDRADREKAEKAEAAKSAAAREANLKRMQGLAGASGGPTDTGAAPRSSGPSSSYGGRVLAALRPNIVLTDPVDGNPQAVVQVRLAPDGTVISKRLLQSSGSKVWDDAVLRAIERTEVLPRDTDGRAPPQFEIGFRPRD